MRVPPRKLLVAERYRYPEFSSQKLKGERHDANDGEPLAVEQDLLPDDIRIAAKAPLPQSMTQDHGLPPPGPIFLWNERAPQDRLNAQQRKEVRCYSVCI